MCELKNILLHCKENEREFERRGIESRDRDINRGWIECAEFFIRNFDVEEKTIKE